MTNRVWVLGDAVVDLVPDGRERYLKCPGGAPANVAVGVARLAGNSGFIGRVGADPLGHFLVGSKSAALARSRRDNEEEQPWNR